MRLKKASKEMKLANQFDNILINNILEKAEEEVFNIVSSFLSQEN
jgi:guanylate kinase